MHNFVYHEPRSVEEACELLQNYGTEARVLAGGTDLIVKFRSGALQPQHVVNIKKIPAMQALQYSGEGLSIGAAVPMNQVEALARKIPAYRVLAEGLHSVASYQLRNRATVVGNLCNASPAADSVPALAVLDAMVEIAGALGSRSLPVLSFCTGPGRTALLPGEWVTGLKIPAYAPDSNGTYLKHSRRRQVDLATAGVAVFHTERTVKIALAAVGPTVIRALAAEELLKEKISDERLAQAARLAAQAAAPIGDIRSSRQYRLHIVEVLTLRALRVLQGGHGPC